MKNIRVVNVTNARTNAVRVTPVKTAKNESDETKLRRSSGCLRRVARRGDSISRSPSVLTGELGDRSNAATGVFTPGRLFGEARGEQRHQLRLLLVEGFECDPAGVELLVHRGDALDQLLGGGGVLVELRPGLALFV